MLTAGTVIDPDGDVIHGPEACPRPCVECDPGHHWMAYGIDPADPGDDEEHPALAFDREHGTEHALGFWQCKHCPAWCELEDIEDDGPEFFDLPEGFLC